MQAIIDLKSKVNVIYPNLKKNLGLYIYNIDNGTLKIDGSRLETFGIIIVFFSIKDKVRKSHVLDKTFLLFNISMSVTLGISFSILSNAKINFNE